ncbi:MAG: 3-deoxy-D-manno-octulosonic acid transferase, partial [Gammaproteobacteria bacterium]|nr:3-deoxy-D-manno-octulosonic acid transferase [Gammaproteobacteria bacterium]
PDSCLLLVPRHPVRGKDVAGLAVRRGFTVRRLGATARAEANDSESTQNDDSANRGEPAQVIVCDTMGQLQTLYGLSHIAFLGGSLVPVGGHNPIEAALCSQPLVVGPHTFNFEEVVAAFAAAQCLSRVETPAQLADTVIAAFEDAAARTAAGARALQAVEQNRGATERLLELLRTRIDAAST